MTSISENKLAGLTLMIGPPIASVLYVVFILLPDLISVDSVDLMDWSLLAQNQSALHLGIRLPLLFIPVLLTCSVFGFSVLNDRLDRFSHFFKFGMNFFVANIIISAAAWGVLQSIVWIGSPAWPMAVVSTGMASYAGFLGSIGLLIIALSIAANKNTYNQTFAYLVSVLMILGILINGAILLDRTEFILSLANPITGITSIIFSVWTFTLGLNLYQDE